MTTESAPTATTQEVSPTLTITIGLFYLALGAGASILAGGDPASLPENFARELYPSIAVVSIFLTTYYLFDVMPAGMAKADCGYMSLDYKDFPLRLWLHVAGLQGLP